MNLKKSKEIYRKWIVGDVVRAGKNEQYLREIMGQIALTTGSSISLQKLAQKTQVGSHHTILDYVNILQDSFALKTLYAIDPNNESFRFKKAKKFYFADPLIFWIALEWSGFSEPSEVNSLIAEQIAGTELLSRYKRIGYLSTRNGEIDFCKPKRWAIEVKWSKAARNISKAFLKSKLPEKIVWTKSNFLNEFPVDS